MKKDDRKDKKVEDKPLITVQKKSANHSEIVAIIMLAVCAFLIVCMLGYGGIIGEGLRIVLFGFFGIIGSTLTVVVAVVLAICILRGTESVAFSTKNILFLSFFILFLTSLFHTLSGAYQGFTDFWSLIASLWNGYVHYPLSGGLIAGGLSSVLQILTQKIGTVVILAPGTLIFAMLLFRFSLLPFFRSLKVILNKLFDKVSVVANNIKQKNEQRKQQKEIEKKQKDEQQMIENSDRIVDAKVFITDDSEKVESENTDINIKNISFDFFDEAETKNSIYNDNTESDNNESVIDTVKGSDEEDLSYPLVQPMLFDEETDSGEENKEAPDDDQGENDNCDTHPVNSTDPVLSSGKFANYRLPQVRDLFSDTSSNAELNKISKQEATEKAQKLIDTLRIYGVEAQISEIHIGPTVTRYEIIPKLGVKMETVKRLSNEIAYSLAAKAIRIEAPIPGKTAVGIEIPNKNRRTVYLKDVLSNDAFKNSKMALPVALGKDIDGNAIVEDIAKLPHLLIAGTTGSGKSVCTNGLIMSLLHKFSPDELRIILFDPKVVEFQNYDGIAHLLLPVVTDSKMAAHALSWAVMEMERRYQYLAKFRLNHITTYNQYAEENGLQKMPYIVIVIDEFADLMAVAKATVETSVQRLSQKARSCGMHLILATQRPSAEVVTGIIKSNMNVRIALKVSDDINSRIVIDTSGAEKLQGNGDMLYHDPKGNNVRIQGVFSPMDEIVRVTDYIRNECSNLGGYDNGILESIAGSGDEKTSDSFSINGEDSEKNDKKEDNYKRAVELLQTIEYVSTSFIQRSLHVGYNTAADLFDRLCEEGYIERSQNPQKKSKVIKK